jgi:hypothetical protein
MNCLGPPQASTVQAHDFHCAWRGTPITVATDDEDRQSQSQPIMHRCLGTLSFASLLVHPYHFHSHLGPLCLGTTANEFNNVVSIVGKFTSSIWTKLTVFAILFCTSLVIVVWCPSFHLINITVCRVWGLLHGCLCACFARKLRWRLPLQHQRKAYLNSWFVNSK